MLKYCLRADRFCKTEDVEKRVLYARNEQLQDKKFDKMKPCVKMKKHGANDRRFMF